MSLLSSLRKSFLSLNMVGINLRTPFFSSQWGRKKPVTVALLQMKSLTSIFETEGPSRAPQTQIVDSLGIHLSIRPVIQPPIASKQTMASIFPAISFSFSSKSPQDEFKMKLAPSFRRIYTCSYFLTILIMSTPSCGSNRFSIRPSDEAAAFAITVLAFFYLASYSRAIAVRGFTKLIEACQKLRDYSIGMHSLDLAIAYWEYVPELRVGVKATRLLTSPQPMRPPPLAKTTPLPSKPGIQGAFLCSQAPQWRKMRSEGLMGAAMTLMSTSPLAGRGMGSSCTENLSGPSSTMAFMVVCSYMQNDNDVEYVLLQQSYFLDHQHLYVNGRLPTHRLIYELL